MRNFLAHSVDFQIPTRLQKLENFEGKASLWVKRDDEIHPSISGNKWRKLKGFLSEAVPKAILTIGGPFSNHLHATAALCHSLSIPCTLIVRGLDADLSNPTLKDVVAWNGNVIRVSREQYRDIRERKIDPIKMFGLADALFIPEGGMGEKGLEGQEELALEIHSQLGGWPDAIVLPVGTGTTAIGLRTFVPNSCRIIGVRCVLDDGLLERWRNRLDFENSSVPEILTSYEWRGFGRYDSKLLEWIEACAQKWDIPLDIIYNGKAFYALDQLFRQGEFGESQKIVYLHTGGLQGNRSLTYFQEKKNRRNAGGAEG